MAWGPTQAGVCMHSLDQRMSQLRLHPLPSPCMHPAHCLQPLHGPTLDPFPTADKWTYFVVQHREDQDLLKQELQRQCGWVLPAAGS